jgi:hypothetical protein
MNDFYELAILLRIKQKCKKNIQKLNLIKICTFVKKRKDGIIVEKYDY